MILLCCCTSLLTPKAWSVQHSILGVQQFSWNTMFLKDKAAWCFLAPFSQSSQELNTIIRMRCLIWHCVWINGDFMQHTVHSLLYRPCAVLFGRETYNSPPETVNQTIQNIEWNQKLYKPIVVSWHCLGKSLYLASNNCSHVVPAGTSQRRRAESRNRRSLVSNSLNSLLALCQPKWIYK